MRSLFDGARRSLGVKEEEVQPLSAGFAGFLCCLGGYFLLLPLRDEAGVSLGTDKLPKLFLASLLLTFLATPLASAFLSRPGPRERGLQLLFRALALSILGFIVLYSAAGTPLPAATEVVDTAAAVTAALRAVDAQHKEPQQGEQHRRQLLLAAAAAGASQLTGAQAAVRVCFFLWVSLLNLVGVSTLWARSADAFSPESAGRLFGLLGAGATLGQLLGSLAAGAMARAPLLGGGGGSPSLLPLLVSAAMLELAGQAAGRYHRVRPSGGSSSSGGAATSPLMAAVAVDAEGLARQATATGAGSSRSGSKAGGASSLARLGSGKASGLQEAADGSAGKSSPSAAANGSLKPSSGSRVTKPGASLLDQLMGRTLEGYRLIRASPYLMHMCAYLALNYVTSSFFYFEKTLVVATVRDAASRTAMFASINSISAFFILGLQLLATGRVLRYLGLPTALSITPAAAGLLMGCIAVWPTPGSVALAEVLRKVLAYSLARPARESLFTVVSREEKYRAKIFLDTVVQRIGDTLAAAAFQALVPALGFGPSGMAAACVPVCAAWSVVAFRLGQRQQRLAAAVAVAKSVVL